MQLFILNMFIAAVALPQDSFPELPQSVYVKRMMSLDKNRDGFLTADELPGKLGQQLKTNDNNADGKLSPQELATMESNARAARDPNSTAKPTGGKATDRSRRTGKGSGLDPAQILRFVMTFDANRDGTLDGEELKKYVVGMAARRAGIRGVQGSNHQPGRSQISPPGKAQPTKGLSADGKGDGGFGE